MELKLERETIDVCKTVIGCSAKQTMDTDLLLPDYCGDIKRILHCGVQPQLRSVSASDDRAAAQGEITVRLLYLNEQNEPDCLEQALPLSVHCRCKAPEQNFVLCAAAATEYVNCRAVSPRKVQLDGAVTVRFEAFAKQPVDFITAIEDCEVLEQEIACSRLSAAAEKTFDLSETVALDEEEPAVAHILSAIGTPLIQSTEAVDDKLLIKGELRLDVVCLSEDRAVHSVTHTLPISQVIEAPGLLPNDALDVSLSLLAAYASVKRDADDVPRLLDLATKVSAAVKAYRGETVRIISDCYATQGSLAPTFGDCRFTRLLAAQPAQTSHRLLLETGVKDGKLLHAAVASVQTETTRRDGAFQLVHRLTVDALLRDGEGNLQHQSLSADVEQSVPFPADAGDCDYTPRAVAQLENPRLAPDGTLEAGVSVTVNGAVFTGENTRVLTDATLQETEAAEPAQLILSFCKGGEDLWSICKRYRAPVAQAKAENGLEADTLADDRMLLISAAP